MNLYLLTQSDNTGYDTYDSCVVVAENKDEARCIVPGTALPRKGDFDRDCWLKQELWSDEWFPEKRPTHTWANKPSTVQVTKIGIATSEYTLPQVICASFNAG